MVDKVNVGKMMQIIAYHFLPTCNLFIFVVLQYDYQINNRQKLKKTYSQHRKLDHQRKIENV